MVLLRFHGRMLALALGAVLFTWCQPAPAAASENSAANASVSAAICPVVYPLDQFPTERGQRYFFFGNAFFINEEGYLITAAHVVESFRGGGRPYVLVVAPDGSRRLEEAELVAADWEHDVAVLRTTLPPSASQRHVAFLSLTAERPSRGSLVTSVSLLPSDPFDSHTSEPPEEVRSEGRIVNYRFHAEGEGAESELLLFSQEIVPGQSGSPVLSADSREVVGIVVGEWLHPTVIQFASPAQRRVMLPGAALRVHYAIALLRRQGISWHTASAAATPPTPAPQAGGFSPPVPNSLVAAPYPPQALLGSEVVLDALIGTDGRIEEIHIVSGGAPFLEPVLNAVRTWMFTPAEMDRNPVEARVGIVFQFPQSFLPKLTARERRYDQPSEDAVGHGALPVLTVEPEYPPDTVAGGSVILYGLVDAQGRIASTRVLSDVAPLTAATLAASQQWQFVPGRQAEPDADSAVVLVVTFRHP